MAITVPTQAYCELSDTSLLLQGRVYDGSSNPTETQAESLVKRIALRIDAIFTHRGLGAPNSSADAGTDEATLLKDYNALGAAVLIESATQAGRGELSTTVMGYREDYIEFMKALAKGEYDGFFGEVTTSKPQIHGDLESGGDMEDVFFPMNEDYF